MRILSLPQVYNLQLYYITELLKSMSFGLLWKVWRASVASARELSGVVWRGEAEVSSPIEQSPKKRKRKKLLMIVDMNVDMSLWYI